MSHLLCRYHVLALISQASLACSPHRCNWDHSCTCDHRCRWDSFAELQRSQQLLRSTEGTQFLLTAALQKNDSTKSNVSFVHEFARLFVVQQGNFGHAILSREKKLKLDGHTQETSAWARTQDTRDEPKSSTHNQGVEQPGGTTQ